MKQKHIDLTRRMLALGALSAIAVPSARAHAPPVGRNGGRQVNAGPFHVELVQTAHSCAVYLTDHALRIPADIDRYEVAAQLSDRKEPCALASVPGVPGAFETTDAGHDRNHGAKVTIVITHGATVTRARFNANHH
ncbi:MAG: hypothetical protein ACRCTI_04250 [Beijerinckiaceae bacterium]